MIFVLKSGVDPLHQLNKLGDALQVDNQIKVLIDDSNQDNREDRTALRKALGNYVLNLPEQSE